MEEKKRVTVYLVRHFFRTTDKHPNGPDLEAFYYCGKRGHVVAKRGSYVESEPWDRPHDACTYELMEYGYKRLCDAKRYAEYDRTWYDKHPSDAFTDHQFTVVAEGYWK